MAYYLVPWQPSWRLQSHNLIKIQESISKCNYLDGGCSRFPVTNGLVGCTSPYIIKINEPFL